MKWLQNVKHEKEYYLPAQPHTVADNILFRSLLTQHKMAIKNHHNVSKYITALFGNVEQHEQTNILPLLASENF
jgi:hypothetical protein